MLTAKGRGVPPEEGHCLSKDGIEASGHEVINPTTADSYTNFCVVK
jgi:hypothetical protein